MPDVLPRPRRIHCSLLADATFTSTTISYWFILTRILLSCPSTLSTGAGTPIGGVRAGWRSDTDAVVISLFVGAAFKLTP